MLKPHVSLVLLLATCCLQHAVTGVRHIVFIVADDLGWNDVGFHNPNMITPNIDALASRGVILNSSYVQPTCTPSRHAFMTGIYPFKVGIQRGALFPGQAQCSPVDMRILPERLKALNYSTHVVGKWHLGYCNWSCTPTYRGFDTFLGYYNGAEDYYTKDIQNGTDFRNGIERDMTDTYSAEVFTGRAVDIINSHDKNAPLFLYLPYQSVHSPIQVPKRYEDMYPNIKDDNRRQFSGMVSALDEGIGNVTEALERSGLMKDTLVIFTADNGGMVTQGGNNYPLRGAKTTVYEGGTRAAAFVSGAGLQKSGYTYDGMMHVVDWNPTILAAAGLETPSGIDGINQWPAISTGGKSDRTEFIYNLDPEILAPTGHAAIRVGDFKLIQGFPGVFESWYKPAEIYADHNEYINDTKHAFRFAEHFLATHGYPDKSFNIAKHGYPYNDPSQTDIKQFELFEELFNLREDPNERNDVKHQHPDVLKELREKLDDYRKQMVTPPDNTNDPVSNPDKWGGYWSPGWC